MIKSQIVGFWKPKKRKKEEEKGRIPGRKNKKDRERGKKSQECNSQRTPELRKKTIEM